MMDYPTVSNVIYYLMFTDSKDEKVWRHVIESTLYQDDVLPITYYKPFKFSRFYLKHNLPQIDIQEYVDRFYYAERYFNQVQMDDYGNQKKYFEMKSFLNQKCLVYPINFMTVHNLFNLHFVFNEPKIAIQYHVKELCRPFSKQPSAKQKLTKILKHEGWEILDVSEKDFKNWTLDEKLENIKGWLKEAK
jgi:hypothetical protein